MDKSYSRRPRLLCRGDGDGRKGGTSFRRELGLRGVARVLLAHAYEGAPGRLVQHVVLGRFDEAMCLRKEVYSNFLKLKGEEAAHLD